ncbi:hypothetical protein HELRODRAFT_147237, partial [Helobdella robusta]
LLAVAIYNNQSESEEELQFKKGDVLAVLDINFNGLNGWWLCRRGEEIGLVPGNRVELI